MEPQRAGRAAGVASVTVTIGTILAAALVSPDFRWTRNALSNLGQPGHPVATPLTTLLFDGGLVVGGVVGLGFGALLWSADGAVGRAAAPVFVATMVAMAAIGIFPQSQALHTPVAVGFYLLSMVTMAVSGAGGLVDGDRRRARRSFGLLAVHVAVWVGWGATGPLLRAGLAIPEMLGAVLIAVWVLVTAADS